MDVNVILSTLCSGVIPWWLMNWCGCEWITDEELWMMKIGIEWDLKFIDTYVYFWASGGLRSVQLLCSISSWCVESGGQGAARWQFAGLLCLLSSDFWVENRTTPQGLEAYNRPETCATCCVGPLDYWSLVYLYILLLIYYMSWGHLKLRPGSTTHPTRA